MQGRGGNETYESHVAKATCSHLLPPGHEMPVGLRLSSIRAWVELSGILATRLLHSQLKFHCKELDDIIVRSRPPPPPAPTINFKRMLIKMNQVLWVCESGKQSDAPQVLVFKLFTLLHR